MTAESDPPLPSDYTATNNELITSCPPVRRDRLGMIALWIALAILLLVTPKIAEHLDSKHITDSIDDGVIFVMQCMLAITGFVGIGFAGVVPMLWLQRASARCVAAIVAQSTGWILFLIGAHYPDSLIRSLDDLSFETCIFLIAAVGGFIPIGIMIWIRRWRLSFAEQNRESRPIGIIDFLTLITVGAAFIAYQTQFGVFSDQSSIPAEPVLIFLAYSAIGATMTASLLVTTRLILGPRKHRFNLGTILGIIATICLALGVWVIVVISDGANYFDSPLQECLIFGITGWMSAAITSVCICLWLRLCGVRLSTNSQ